MTPSTPSKIPSDEQIGKWLAQRDKILTRRDALIDSARVDAIDRKLQQVPPGHNNRVDLALMRPCAILLHQCGWCGEWYTGARVDHGCPAPQERGACGQVE